MTKIKKLSLSDLIGAKVIGGTAGSVLFVDDNGKLGQDNTNLFWDGSNLKVSELGLYDPRTQPLQYPAENIFNNFQSGHGLTKQSAAGTQTDDTTDFIKGDQSLQLVTDGDGVAVFTTDYSIPSNIDLTDMYLKIWIKVDEASNSDNLWLYLSSDGLSSDFYTWFIENPIDYIKDGTWTPITLSFGDAFATGSPDRSSINAIQLRIKDKGSSPLTVNWGGLSYIPEPTKGIVSIVFDDSFEGQYTEARKKMDEYGFAGTTYIIPSNIGTIGRLTLEELEKLQNKAGWDVAAHHETDLTTLTAAEVEETVLSVKNYLLVNGFSKGADHFAYPMGKYNETIVLPIMRKYFTSARTTVDYGETYPPADYHKLRVKYIENTTTPASIATAVDDARVNSEWLILVFHNIIDPADDPIEYSVANFGTVIDDIASDGILVRTISDVINNGEESITFTATSKNIEFGDRNLITNGKVGIGTTTPTLPLDVEAKSGHTAIGGFAIKLTNTTGSNTVQGQTVKADPTTNDAVILTAADDVECFGVFLESGIADDAEAWVVVSGIADVAMGDNELATAGNWVETNSSEAGYADATANSPAAAPQHFNEIGHCIETVSATGGGTHILARCVLHFN